jgi:two-component system OmpR family response regulator
MTAVKKILLVEDDIFLVRVYENMMPKGQFEVEYVTDGSEVAEKVAQQKYDLILLDIVMPKKDGFTVLKELKANKKTQQTPVFVLSKMSSKEDIDLVTQLGAEKFLNKTEHSFAQVIKLIEERLR